MKRQHIHIHPDDLEACAAQFVTTHDQHIRDGFRVRTSSSIWQISNGTVTARFVYRKPHKSILHTVSGLQAIWWSVWL